MKNYTFLAIVMSLFISGCKNEKANKIEFETSTLTKPSKKQIAFTDWEVGAFLHFGLNVFTGQEYGDGKRVFFKI